MGITGITKNCMYINEMVRFNLIVKTKLLLTVKNRAKRQIMRI